MSPSEVPEELSEADPECECDVVRSRVGSVTGFGMAVASMVGPGSGTGTSSGTGVRSGQSGTGAGSGMVVVGSVGVSGRLVSTNERPSKIGEDCSVVVVSSSVVTSATAVAFV